MLNRAVQSLKQVTEERINPVALEHLARCNQHHRSLIAQKVESYFATRHRAAYLQQQTALLATQLARKRDLVKDAKKQLSKEATTLSRLRRQHRKEETDLRREINRADQRIQRQLRHVSPCVPWGYF